MAPNAKKGRRTPSLRSVLPAESELRDQCPVPLDVVAPEVIQQPPTLTHEHEQSTAAVMVLLVDLQVLREMVDAPREERHLHLRRAGVGLVEAVLGDRGSGIGHAETGILRCTEAGNLPRTGSGGRLRVLGPLRWTSWPRIPRANVRRPV